MRLVRVEESLVEKGGVYIQHKEKEGKRGQIYLRRGN
jgi:hypothetical protein